MGHWKRVVQWWDSCPTRLRASCKGVFTRCFGDFPSALRPSYPTRSSPSVPVEGISIEARAALERVGEGTRLLQPEVFFST